MGVPLGFLVGGITGLLFYCAETRGKKNNNSTKFSQRSFHIQHGKHHRTHPEGVSVGVLVLVVGMLVTVGLSVGLAVSKLKK